MHQRQSVATRPVSQRFVHYHRLETPVMNSQPMRKEAPNSNRRKQTFNTPTMQDHYVLQIPEPNRPVSEPQAHHQGQHSAQGYNNNLFLEYQLVQGHSLLRGPVYPPQRIQMNPGRLPGPVNPPQRSQMIATQRNPVNPPPPRRQMNPTQRNPVNPPPPPRKMNPTQRNPVNPSPPRRQMNPTQRNPVNPPPPRRQMNPSQQRSPMTQNVRGPRPEFYSKAVPQQQRPSTSRQQDPPRTPTSSNSNNFRFGVQPFPVSPLDDYYLTTTDRSPRTLAIRERIQEHARCLYFPDHSATSSENGSPRQQAKRMRRLDTRKKYENSTDPSKVTTVDLTVDEDVEFLRDERKARSFPYEPYDPSADFRQYLESLREMNPNVLVEQLNNPLRPRIGSSENQEKSQSSLLTEADLHEIYKEEQRITKVKRIGLVEGVEPGDQPSFQSLAVYYYLVSLIMKYKKTCAYRRRDELMKDEAASDKDELKKIQNLCYNLCWLYNAQKEMYRLTMMTPFMRNQLGPLKGIPEVPKNNGQRGKRKETSAQDEGTSDPVVGSYEHFVNTLLALNPNNPM